MLEREIKISGEDGQKESGRRSFLIGTAVVLWTGPAWAAGGDLDDGGLTFRDFASEDRGASFGKGGESPVTGSQPDQHAARVLQVDNANGLARIRFEPVKIEVSVPLGWQTSEDWERGVAFSADQSYRLILWKVDFAYEGVKDAEHYAATKAGTIQARRKGVQAQARRLDDGTCLVAYEYVPIQGSQDKRTVFDLVFPNPKDAKQGALMTLGVPAMDGNRGLKLLALLKQSIRIDW
jgi:hypothetical protein